MLNVADYQLNAYALPNLLVGCGAVLWGLMLWWREPDSDAGAWAIGVGLAAAAWQVGFAVAYCVAAHHPLLAQRWIVLAQTGVILLPPTLYELLRRLLGLQGWRNALSPAVWTAAVLFLFLVWATPLYLGTPYRYSWGYYAHYRTVGTLQAAELCGVMVFLFVQCWRTWQGAPQRSMRRYRARILLVGFGVAFTAAVDFIACWGVPVYPFGYLMVGFTIAAIIYATWRYRVVAVTSPAAADHVLRTLSDGVLVLDDSGAIALANERAAALLGTSAPALRGRTPADVLPALAALLQAPAADPDMRAGEVEIRRSGGARGTCVLAVRISRMHAAHDAAPITVWVLQDITRYREAEARIRELVYVDQATGLANRRNFCDIVTRALRHGAPGRGVAVGALRVQRSRYLADYPARQSRDDPLLAEIASRLERFARMHARHPVSVARLQGYEFAVLLEHTESLAQASSVLGELLGQLREPVTLDDQPVAPAVRLGVSLYPDDGQRTERLMEYAAAALDQAAEAGDEHVHFYNASTNAAAVQAVMLRTRLAHAIDHDELRVYFQPIVSASSGAIAGAEALVRWCDPVYGLRPPGEFIPVAEQSRLITALDRWVLHAACRQAVAWPQKDPTVAINLSGANLVGSAGVRLAATVEEALRLSGLAATRLEIEITENHIVGRQPEVIQCLQRLRSQGVRIVLDDFGTGYASLSYLQWFPLDKLKIDQSYVLTIGQDAKKTALLESILVLADQLGLEVVAEGVETPYQAAFLRRRRCDYLQGFLFSRPQPAEAFSRLLASWASGEASLPAMRPAKGEH